MHLLFYSLVPCMMQCILCLEHTSRECIHFIQVDGTYRNMSSLWVIFLFYLFRHYLKMYYRVNDNRLAIKGCTFPQFYSQMCKGWLFRDASIADKEFLDLDLPWPCMTFSLFIVNAWKNCLFQSYHPFHVSGEGGKWKVKSGWLLDC